jgi:large conductance mechanosensitive channel
VCSGPVAAGAAVPDDQLFRGDACLVSGFGRFCRHGRGGRREQGDREGGGRARSTVTCADSRGRFVGLRLPVVFSGFKDFISRGNVIDLAVGVVIGAAFNGLVTTFTTSFLQPLIKLLAGGREVSGEWHVRDVVFNWSAFLNALIAFLLTAMALYYVVVLPANKIAERRARGEEPEPKAPAEDIRLLTEIRDALIAQRHR